MTTRPKKPINKGQKSIIKKIQTDFFVPSSYDVNIKNPNGPNRDIKVNKMAQITITKRLFINVKSTLNMIWITSFGRKIIISEFLIKSYITMNLVVLF